MEKDIMIKEQPLTKTDIRAQVNLIQEVMKEVMKKDVHFGVIPGCQKPTLYKPGAEKLASTFRLAVDPLIEDLSSADEAKYRIRVKLTSMQTGNFVGIGIGECSSDEEKYKWRKAVCDAEFDETAEDRKREKWCKGQNRSTYQVKQVRTNIADIANTILKMAKKRALIDAVLTSTAASDIFSQDIEDLPKEMQEDIATQSESSKPQVDMPQSKSESQPTGDVITEPQRKRLYAIAMQAGMTQDTFKEWLLFNFELESTKAILKSDYQKICEKAELYKVE